MCCFFIHSYVRVYLFLLVFLLLSPLLALVLFASCVYSSMRYCALWSIKRLFLSRLFMFFFPFNIFFFRSPFFFSFILCVGCCWIHLKEHKITCARLLLLLLLLLFNRSFHRRITTISIKIILCVCACSCSPNKNSVQFLSMARGLNTCGILQTIVTEMVLRVSWKW